MPPQSLAFANTASETLAATMPAMETSSVPTVAAAPVAGDNTNASAPPASATVMIVIGVVLGIVGVASVITLIWWMRKRAITRLQMSAALMQSQGLSRPPAPPPKFDGSGSSKELPPINIVSANSYVPGGPNRSNRSNTSSSIDKDKALPIKPPESVWTSPVDRHNKSPALTSIHELTANKSPRRPQHEETGARRMRSDSLASYKSPTAPTDFI